MKTVLGTIGQLLLRLLVWTIEKIRDNIVEVQLPRLRIGENLLRLLLALLFLLVLAPASMKGNVWLGLSFLVAAITAIWKGWIYRDRGAMALVYVGAILGSLVTGLAKDAWKALRSGDYASVVVILGLAALIYYMAREFKRGCRPRL